MTLTQEEQADRPTPTTMRAAVLTAPGRFSLRDVPIPEVGPDDALVRVDRCGICGMDVRIFDGHYSADRLPLVPGHELAGTIAATGKNVIDIAPGDRVVVDINIGCGRCYYCRRNEILNCPASIVAVRPQARREPIIRLILRGAIAGRRLSDPAIGGSSLPALLD